MTQKGDPSISSIVLSEVIAQKRIDSEYFQPEFLEVATQLRGADHKRLEDLGTIVTSAFYPAATDLYEHGDVPFIRGVDVITYPVITNDQPFERIPLSFIRESKGIQELYSGDIVITKVGTPCYAGILHKNLKHCALSRTVLGLKDIDTEVVDPYYLVVFLRCRYGFFQLMREREQQIQLQLTLDRVGRINVFLPEKAVQVEIGNILREYHQQTALSQDLYRQAEQLLLDELELSDLDRSVDLFGEASVFDTFCASRIDSDFFEPKYDKLLEHLYNLGTQPLGDMARLRQEKFSAQIGVNFNYIEISDVDLSNGLCHASEIPGEEAPDRAQQIVRASDIVVSTVRPHRGGIALIHPKQDGFVCSSGFAVLEPLSVSAEYLLVYLRLKPIRELLNRSNRASMYPAVTASDVLNLPIIVSDDNEMTVRGLIQESHQAYSRGLELLEQAKRKVEAMIESEAMHG